MKCDNHIYLCLGSFKMAGKHTLASSTDHDLSLSEYAYSEIIDAADPFRLLDSLLPLRSVGGFCSPEVECVLRNILTLIHSKIIKTFFCRFPKILAHYEVYRAITWLFNIPFLRLISACVDKKLAYLFNKKTFSFSTKNLQSPNGRA